MNTPTDFLAIEIDAVDEQLAATATRKRIPVLKIGPTSQQVDERSDRDAPSKVALQSQPTHRPRRRKPLSLEVPDYLATELKVAAATQSVTVRHLVLSALVDAGYRVDAVDMDEDGRRLR